MKCVVLVTRPDAVDRVGGDTEQIRQIGGYLERNLYKVIITSDLESVINQADIVFLFNLTRIFDLFSNYEIVNKYKKKYILFPVYWDLDDVIPKSARVGIRRLLFLRWTKGIVNLLRLIKFVLKDPLIARLFNPSWINLHRKVRKIVNSASLVCCNSKAEERHLKKKFMISDNSINSQVIYNGINLSLINETSIDFVDNKVPNEYYVCVGAIGPRKNQLILIQAAIKAKVCLVIVGPESQDKDYVKRVYELSQKQNVFFLGQVTPLETLSIIKKSKGHIQPSFIETPGLASLEAASLGVPIVVSNIEPVNEYFEDRAIYCDPYSIDSIYHAILKIEEGSVLQEKSFYEKYDWNVVLHPLLRTLGNL